MASKNLASYLNHHLAASVGWLEAVERLEAAEKGTAMGRNLAELRAEGIADRQVLVELMARLRVGQRETEKATAWMGEKLSRLMLPLRDSKEQQLNVLLILETLSLGLEGRRALWQALGAAAQEATFLQGPDYQTLTRRSEEQRSRMELLRLEVARRALSAP